VFTRRFADVDLGYVRVWIGAAALAFLVHCTVSTTLFTAGAMTPLVALYALGRNVEIRNDAAGDNRPRKARGVRAGALCLILFIVIGAYVRWEVMPAWRSTALLSAARRLEQLDGPPAVRIQAAYEAASAADPWDPTAPDELARWLAASAHLVPHDSGAATRQLGHAVEAARAALQRDPQRAMLRRQVARLQQALWKSNGRQAALIDAIASLREAAELSPSRPESLVELGDLLVGAAEAVNASAELQFDVGALLKRLRPGQIAEIERKLIHIDAIISSAR
jgi:hypothetical protein